MKDVHGLYLKIIGLVYANIKELGFYKVGSVNLYRARNEILQILNFQKGFGGNSLTINTAIRPFFWHRPEGYYLVSCKRVGYFDKGCDAWYPIKHDHLRTADRLTTLLIDKVVSYFDKFDSVQKVVTYVTELENQEPAIYDDLILFSALRHGDKELSKRYLDKRLNLISNDYRNIEWQKLEFAIFSELMEMVETDDFEQVNRKLDHFKTEFLHHNSKVK